MHMKLDHFKTHKQEYAVFSIVAILIVVAVRMVQVSEAQAYPLSPEAMMAGNFNSHCPQFMRHFHGPLFMFPQLCGQLPLQPDTLSVAPMNPQASISIENATGSQTVATTTQATASTSLETASSTQEASTTSFLSAIISATSNFLANLISTSTTTAATTSPDTASSTASASPDTASSTPADASASTSANASSSVTAN